MILHNERALLVIANGRGPARALDRAVRELRRLGFEPDVVRTTGPGHATSAARDAVRAGGRLVVAAGGDGTVHEVANGLLADGHGADTVLGVLPMGSGSDFVRSFGIPRTPVRAARRLADGEVRRIDVGLIRFDSGESRYFVNIAEAGLGGAVVARAARLPRFLGPGRYLAAFCLVLPRFETGRTRVAAGDDRTDRRTLNVVIANCRYYGGGMRISPKSAPDDGMLDILVMTGPKRSACATMPRVFLGRYLPHPHVTEMRGNTIRIDGDAPYLVEADGELLGPIPATFEVLPGALRLRA
ncbi:MAG TPA: diacylglycerol kinase family protein [Streptosporangiaceae bacterium]|nr:diacylglycerol kinase family protein [Streptosporangiaceae bacterium]